MIALCGLGASIGEAAAAEVVRTVLMQSGEALPGDAASTLTSFGTPSIDDQGRPAFLAHWSNSTGNVSGILARTPTSIRTKTGDAPGDLGGAKLKSMREAIIDQNGRVTFVATLTGPKVIGANNHAILSESLHTTLKTVARTGGDAVGGGKFAAFKSVTASASTSTTGAVAFDAILQVGVGGVTARDAHALYIYGSTESAVPMYVGLPYSTGGVSGSYVKSYTALTPRRGTPDGGGGLVYTSGQNYAPGVALLQNGRSAWFSTDQHTDVYTTALTNTPAPGYLNPETKFSSFGPPTLSSAGLSTDLVTVAGGGVTKTNNQAIYHENASDYSLIRAVAKGDPAPGLGMAKFIALGNPLLNAAGDLAFLGTVKGEDVSARTDTGVWWIHGGELQQIAREGNQPPGAGTTGVTFRGFTSLALPDGTRGPLFTATLAGAVNRANGYGFYGIGTDGMLHEILRVGDLVTDSRGMEHTIKSFKALQLVAGTPSAVRGYNNSGSTIVRALYAEGGEGILKIDLP